MSDRDLDLVLLGATGFTGRLTAGYLASRLQGTSTRWAIAGRDRGKLEAVAEGLPVTPEIEVVDVDDLVGLVQLAERTRVLASTVGPYIRRGELVVQACVRAGTHYADITGEPAFVDLVRDRYDGDAKEHGSKVVNCCGFESVPPDLGTRYTVGHLPDDAPLVVRGYVRAQGRPSGGTALTTLDLAASRRFPRTATATSGVRRAVALPPRIHRSSALDAYGIPLPTIDTSIVLRSARVLEGYGSAFRYGYYARVKRLPTAIAGIGALGAGAALASFGPTRAALARLLPRSGEGPDASTREESWFEITFVGQGAGRQVVTRVSGGDPGYDATSRMLGEAMLALAAGDGPDVAGVLTPAVGLGSAYEARLVNHALTFELLAVH